MKSKEKFLLATVFLIFLFGTSLMTSFGFSTTPQHTDPTGDAGASDYEDIINVWIDNNASHIMFKLDFVGPFNETLSGNVVYALISINPLTGDSSGFAAGFLNDYLVGLSANGSAINIVLYDDGDSLNSLSTNNHLGYSNQSNDNKTIEFGYKLRTYQGAKGYLNLTLGQTIEIKFYAGGDTDVAPNDGLDPISYTLKKSGDLGWIIVLIILFPVIGVALGLFIYYRRKDIR